jgi:hypothetical protein
MPVNQTHGLVKRFGGTPVKGCCFVVCTVTPDMTRGNFTITVQNLHEISPGLLLQGFKVNYRSFTEFNHSRGILRLFIF